MKLQNLKKVMLKPRILANYFFVSSYVVRHSTGALRLLLHLLFIRSEWHKLT